jgi:perosamine synthetase
MSSVPATRHLLAVHGGVPVRKTLLPYGHQLIEESDIQAVAEALRSDWLTAGPKTEQFERAFAEYVGAKFSVSFSSGTAALHAAAFTANLRSGDEVITSPLTFAATANSVLYQGATPVFADVCNDTLNLDPQKAGDRITSKTKALIAVDYAGHPASLTELRDIADKHGLILIEDACHALGAEYHNRKVGSFSDMTVFSFHPVKHLTTGEGGMVTTDNPYFERTLRMFRNHGLSTDARQRQSSGQCHYDMVLLGFNYRLPDIACALGLAQIGRLAGNLARRREIAEVYGSRLAFIPGLTLPVVRESVLPAWHLYPVRIESGRLRASRDEILAALRAENIGVNVHYPPVHLHSFYRETFGYCGGEYPIAESAARSLISLPMFHGMTHEDVEDVIEAVEKVVSHFGN